MKVAVCNRRHDERLWTREGSPAHSDGWLGTGLRRHGSPPEGQESKETTLTSFGFYPVRQHFGVLYRGLFGHTATGIRLVVRAL